MLSFLSLIITIILENYIEQRINNMDKFLEDYGFKLDYQKAGAKSKLLYLLTVIACIYIVYLTGDIKAWLYELIEKLSGGSNSYIAVFNTAFNIAILFLMASIYYLYRVRTRKILASRYKLDEKFHKYINRMIVVTVVISWFMQGVVLFTGKGLYEIYLKYIDFGVIAIGIIVVNMIYVFFYYKIHKYK